MGAARSPDETPVAQLTATLMASGDVKLIWVGEDRALERILFNIAGVKWQRETAATDAALGRGNG